MNNKKGINKDKNGSIERLHLNINPSRTSNMVISFITKKSFLLFTGIDRYAHFKNTLLLMRRRANQCYLCSSPPRRRNGDVC